MVTEHKDYLSSLPGVAMWLLTHKLMLCAHLPGHSPGGSRLGSFSCYLEQSQVDKRNTWRLAGDQAEELDDAHEHLSVLAEPEGGGVTVHLMFSCPPFPGSETQPCSAFQDVYLFSEAPAAGGDAGVRSRFTGGLRCSECLTIWISVDKSLKSGSGSHSGVSGSL